MATEIWVNIGSGNGLLPDGNVDLSSVRSSDINLRASSKEISQPSITEIIWKINCLKFYSNFPGASELIQCWFSINEAPRIWYPIEMLSNRTFPLKGSWRYRLQGPHHLGPGADAFDILRPGALFTNHRNSNSMEISFCSRPSCVKWSLWNFAHFTTILRSWHVQNIVIRFPTTELH